MILSYVDECGGRIQTRTQKNIGFNAGNIIRSWPNSWCRDLLLGDTVPSSLSAYSYKLISKILQELINIEIGMNAFIDIDLELFQ